jgi:hypothetical protein
VGPDNGLNKLLPVTPATEKEHQAKSPDEVSSEEEETIATTRRSIPTVDCGRVLRVAGTPLLTSALPCYSSLDIGGMRPGRAELRSTPSTSTVDRSKPRSSPNWAVRASAATYWVL